MTLEHGLPQTPTSRNCVGQVLQTKLQKRFVLI